MFRTLFAAALAAVASASPLMGEDDVRYRPIDYATSGAARAEINAEVLKELELTQEQWTAINERVMSQT